VDVVIVGGGVAGLTLAAKLLQQGRTPVVVERAETYEDLGYGLGLYPLGGCVFHGLGQYERLLDAAQVLATYEIADHKGEVLQAADVQDFTDFAGPMIMVERFTVIDVLRDAAAGADIKMGTTVSVIDQSGDRVSISLSDGTELFADVVAVCDGQHSTTRPMVFGEQEPFDTGWVFWTWWGDLPGWPRDTAREAWGAGRFFGVYPCKDRYMCGAGMPVEDDPGCHDDPEAARAFLVDRFEELIAADRRYEAAISTAASFFRWPMTDVRAKDWVNGRIALCGDAGAAFLPTAGVGASNALRAASSLADELSRAGPTTVPLALELYEKRCRELVERNQRDSRRLAKLMFVDHKLTTWVRDRMVEHYPAAKFISGIVEASRTPF